MIIFSIICAVMYFISAIILFMPKFRKYPFFKPFGVYMAYQGIWTLLSCLVDRLFPTNQVMSVLNYLGSFVFCLYFLFIYFVSRRKSKKAGKAVKKTNKAKSSEKKRTETKRRQPKHTAGDDFDEVIKQRKKHYAKPYAESEELKAETETSAPEKKENRFSENSRGVSKYSLSDDDLYDDFDDYDSIPDDDSEELENVEITDEDLKYDEDEDDSSEDSGEIDLYDDFDDNLMDDENEENISDTEDDDLYYDFDDYDDDEDDSSALKGRRYKK